MGDNQIKALLQEHSKTIAELQARLKTVDELIAEIIQMLTEKKQAKKSKKGDE